MQPDITKGNDPYEESKPIATTEPTTNSSYVSASMKLTVTQTLYSIEINNDNYGDAASVLANSTYFRVAARCVDTYSDLAYFGLRSAGTKMGGGPMIWSYNGDSESSGLALRPVVSLPYSLLTGEQTNGAWNLSK